MPSVRINGEEYPLIEADDYDLDEWKVFYSESGITAREYDDLGEGFHPGATKAAIVVSIARAKPELKLREISEVVGKLKLSDLGEAFVEEEEEDDAVPPTGESETDEPDGSSGVTGNDGSETEDSPEPATPEDIGVPASDTTSGSDRLTSVA